MINQTLHTPPITAEELKYPQVILGVIYFIINFVKILRIIGYKGILVIWEKLKQGNGRGTCCWSTTYKNSYKHIKF